MPKHNSTSKIGRGRKGAVPKSKGFARNRGPRRRGARIDLGPTSFEATLEVERTRLLKAEAVLNCVGFALSCSSWNADDGTTYAMAVDVVRELVQESMNRLELIDREPDSRKSRPN